ncbi:exocyst complex component EXO70B1-like [Vigna radiata var. radiata]|uniref:Exocyst subunit Exo70 family protein n=1 Tax=Vigna radiata var. radiata TaxID=3916 RepID=A0A1S3UAN0_VIGRR|nr:exocyst complex component EXO70B1-like [Vigna radiata var. radiata]
MLSKIGSWLHQPKVWRLVCFASSIVGLICYALSSSFNLLLGNWTWWKLLLYITFSFLISLSTLFAKTWEYSNSRCLEAHTAFSVLLITSVYSFFLDKDLKQKTDTYSLLSCVAFAIMSLGLSRLSQLGFEVDLLYFFCALLTIQLMKIKLWLVTVGGVFSYSLILLRCNLDPQPRSGYHGLQHQDHVMLEIDSPQPHGTSNSVTQVDSTQTIMASSQPYPVIDMVWPSRGSRHSASQVVSPQEGGAGGAPPENIYGSKECFMGCIEALKKENGSVIIAIFMHVDKYLKASVLSEEQISVPEYHGDDNMVVDSLSSGMINKLRENVQKMVSDGFLKECLHVYSNWRREFLKESLWALGLQVQELNEEDINKSEKIEMLIKAMNIAARILFPNEKRLFIRVFSGSIRNVEFHFRELCTELVTILLKSALALATWSHFMRNTLQELIQDFESFTSGRNIIVRLIRRRLCIYEALEDVSLITGGGIHPITHAVMYYIYSINRNREISKLSQDLKEGKIPSSVHRARVRILLESKSKYGNKLTLMYYIKSLNQSRESKLRQGLEDEMLSPVYLDRMTELLESCLVANSKNCKNPSLGHVFIMNNRRFIEVETRLNGLGHFFGDDWLHKNTTKIQENRELYLRSSWNKIVDLLKVDINQLETSVVAELIKDNLYWFNELFDEACNIQSTWPVCDEELREQIIKSIENMLLPAYGSFLGTFEEFFGKYAYKYIKYGMFEVQDRLSKLFLVRE